MTRGSQKDASWRHRISFHFRGERDPTACGACPKVPRCWLLLVKSLLPLAEWRCQSKAEVEMPLTNPHTFDDQEMQESVTASAATHTKSSSVSSLPPLLRPPDHTRG